MEDAMRTVGLWESESVPQSEAQATLFGRPIVGRPLITIVWVWLNVSPFPFRVLKKIIKKKFRRNAILWTRMISLRGEEFAKHFY